MDEMEPWVSGEVWERAALIDTTVQGVEQHPAHADQPMPGRTIGILRPIDIDPAVMLRRMEAGERFWVTCRELIETTGTGGA